MSELSVYNRRSTAPRSGQLEPPGTGGFEDTRARRAAGGRAELVNSVHDSTADQQETRNRLVRFAYRFTWDQGEAEDVAHEALVIAQERASSLRDQRSWWSWVCRIVVRRCQERGRRRSLWRRHAPAYAARTQQHHHTESLVDAAESSAEVAKLLGRLPPRQYEVVVLRHLEGMGFAEIAETLGISAATARVHARAGRETLRKLMVRSAGD